MMNPTKYCNAVKCTDCKHYQDCLQYEINVNKLKGKSLPEIKIVKILDEEKNKNLAESED